LFLLSTFGNGSLPDSHDSSALVDACTARRGEIAPKSEARMKNEPPSRLSDGRRARGPANGMRPDGRCGPGSLSHMHVEPPHPDGAWLRLLALWAQRHRRALSEVPSPAGAILRGPRGQERG
jgi:hypothetical protein